MRFFSAVDVQIRGACVCVVRVRVPDCHVCCRCFFRVRWQLCVRLFALFATWVMARAYDILADARSQPVEAKCLLDALIDVPVEMTPSDGSRERHTIRLHVRSWRDAFQSDRVRTVSTSHLETPGACGVSVGIGVFLDQVLQTYSTCVSVRMEGHATLNEPAMKCAKEPPPHV